MANEQKQETKEQELSLTEIGKLTPAMQEAQAQKNMLNMLFKQSQFYSQSTIVPKEYQGNQSNCFIAIQMAKRMNADPFQVMQSLNIIQGRPAWSSQFIISAINTCGRFKTPLNYRVTGSWKDKTFSCVAYATAKDGTLCESIAITWQLANDEGWIAKSGSKWKTMPELMARYRAASFFGKQFCPEILMGLQSAEEQQDIINLEESDYKVKSVEDTTNVVRETIERNNKIIEPTFGEKEFDKKEEPKVLVQPQQIIADNNGVIENTEDKEEAKLFEYED